jgi:alanyl-tRNA synthetase
MTPEQIAEVEKLVNEKIVEEIPVIRTDMPKEEAEKLGAEHEFGVKYPDTVSVYSIGALDSAFSIEFCGGPHVTNTAELSSIRESDGSIRKTQFKIVKEEASSAGIRRIKAVLQ